MEVRKEASLFSCEPRQMTSTQIDEISTHTMNFSVKFVCVLFAVLLIGLLAVDHVSAMHMGQRGGNNGVMELLVAGLIAKLLQEQHHHG
ncbi:hypothetical protein AVEN_177570-1 [Araneus ventricosus]|uniref:Uncharacterized protein n=1 Tax=Araneus ventricosus TaxID=182803 RepID=A0A4Y2MJ27_ARAVE|nr:hypothetical protein AVEN_177570-1 [Araneus ventricosus]